MRGVTRAAALAIAASVALILPATAGALNQVTFSQVGNLTTPRQYPGTARLPDGQILLVGGYDGTDDLNTAEIFDPKTNTFSASGLGTMAEGRYAPVAAALPGGRILVAGGYDGTSDSTSAEVFDPNTRSFSSVGSMAVPREEAGVAPLPDGRVLVVGGYSDTDAVNSTEIFNPSTNTFSPGPSLPLATYAPATAVITGGRILVAGGFDSSEIAEAFVFNPSSSVFSAVQPLPAPTYAAGGASLPGGRALVVGGYDGDLGDYTTRALIFDPATNAFSSAGIGNLIQAREEPGTIELPDGRVLVAGGFNSPDRLDSAEVLSVPSNAFKTKLKGRKVKVTVTTEGTASATDVSTKVATTAKKKKKPKLVKTTSKHGGPGTIVVKIKLTKQGTAKLRQKGKLQVRVSYTPDGGVAATKKLKLRAGK
jgi:hypothetical protein